MTVLSCKIFNIMNVNTPKLPCWHSYPTSWGSSYKVQECSLWLRRSLWPTDLDYLLHCTPAGSQEDDINRIPCCTKELISNVAAYSRSPQLTQQFIHIDTKETRTEDRALPCTIHNSKLFWLGSSPADQSCLIFIDKDQGSQDSCWHVLLVQLIKQYAKLAHITCLGEVKKCDNASPPSPASYTQLYLFLTWSQIGDYQCQACHPKEEGWHCQTVSVAEMNLLLLYSCQSG